MADVIAIMFILADVIANFVFWAILPIYLWKWNFFDVVVTDVIVTMSQKEIMADDNAMFYNG